MINLFPRLPLGGKLLAKQGDEGQPNNIQAFFSKSRFTSNRVLGFPVGEAVGFCRLKRSLQSFPLPEKNSANFIFSAKMISLFHRLPLGGKLLAKQGDEGQPNNIQPFSLQKAALYSTLIPGFPFGEAVGFRRLKRSLQAFPLPEKNSANFIFSAKIVSHFVLSPFLHALPVQSIPALSLSSLLYPGFRRSGSSRPLPSPFFILPALQKPFLLAILSLRIVFFAGSTIIIS